MDFILDVLPDGNAATLTAVSDRAREYLEERLGVGVAALLIRGTPEDVFRKLPPDWQVGNDRPRPNLVN